VGRGGPLEWKPWEARLRRENHWEVDEFLNPILTLFSHGRDQPVGDFFARGTEKTWAKKPRNDASRSALNL